MRKDNTGYDLKDLFIGSEGTLGIVTAAGCGCFRAPEQQAMMFAALPDLEDVLGCSGWRRRRRGPALTAFELLPRIGVEFVLRHAPGTRDPFGRCPSVVCAGRDFQPVGGRARPTPPLPAIAEAAFEAGVSPMAVIASTLAQRAALSGGCGR